MSRNPVLNDEFPGTSLLYVVIAIIALGWPWLLWNAHGHPWGWAVLGVTWDIVTVPLAAIMTWQHLTRT